MDKENTRTLSITQLFSNEELATYSQHFTKAYAQDRKAEIEELFKTVPVKEIFEVNEPINYRMLFYLFNQKPYKTHVYDGIDRQAIAEYLPIITQLDTFQILNLKYFIAPLFANDKISYRQSLIIVSKDILLYVNEYEDNHIELLYGETANRTTLDYIIQIIKKCTLVKLNKPKLLLIGKDEYTGSLSLKEFSIPFVQLAIEKYYNDDFLPIHQLIIEKLSTENGKGIVLLHGKPGTGKTTYIRHLVGSLRKQIIYLPPDITSALTSPDFLGLMRKSANSILIIEDAENVIQQRTGGENGAIANLLNLCDGLLSDVFNIQVVCTFNTSISKIDPALLRQGRLIGSYYFDALQMEKAQALAKSLSLPVTIDKDVTLAELFNANNNNIINTLDGKIGFKNK